MVRFRRKHHSGSSAPGDLLMWSFIHPSRSDCRFTLSTRKEGSEGRNMFKISQARKEEQKKEILINADPLFCAEEFLKG